MALVTALEVLDIVLAKTDTAYANYTDAYDVYLTIMSEHGGGLIRFVNGEATDVYTKEQIYAAVNRLDNEGNHDAQNAQPEDWYHREAHPNDTSSQPQPESIDVHWPKKGWDFKDLDRSFKCVGDCKFTFDTPISGHKFENQVRCTHQEQFTNHSTNITKLFQCTVLLDYSCEKHIHLFSPDYGYTNYRVSTSSQATTQDCDTCTSTSECSTCSSDGDASESTPTTPSYHVCDSHESWQSGTHSAASCGQSGHFVCDSLSHVEEQCTTTNTNGSRCTYTFWRCEHPYVPSYGPSHIHTYPVPPPPAVFTPSLSLTHNSSTSSVSMTATANEPIFGADLYIYFPDRTYHWMNKYGTKIGWTSGNSDATTYSLPVNYSFPASAASGTYKFTLRVYPFNNSGSGDAWGDPYDVFEDVTVD